jgi:hypothetical protein
MEFLFGEGQFGLRILLAVFLVLALSESSHGWCVAFAPSEPGLRADVRASPGWR